MYSDPIADMLTRIRNANLRRHLSLLVPHSKLKEAVLNVMLDEGFIGDFKVIEDKASKYTKQLEVKLKYKEDGGPVIRSIKKVSVPGRRVLKGYRNLRPVLNSQGIQVISTSTGVKSDNECRENKIGGEVLCEIY